MRIIFYLLQKEFIQVFRNRTMLPLIFVLPIVQLLVLVNAATMDMKNLKLTISDQDRSPSSRRLVSELDASPFFLVKEQTMRSSQAIEHIEQGNSDLALIIPAHLEREMMTGQTGRLQLLANAINSQQSQLGYAYILQVTSRWGRNFSIETHGVSRPSSIATTASYWYNPELNYKHFMLPGILVILVSVIGMFLTAMNLVREKEMGTIEQINVTPVRKSQFIIAKLIPFLLIGLFELGLGLGIGKLIYGMPIVGSLGLIFWVAAIYLIGLLGMGLLISTFSNSQQQVMFISYFFLLIFILMSGIFTSAENMPLWGQRINVINPLYYFIDVMRSVLLKGSGFFDLWHQIFAISVFAIVLVTLSVFNYRKTVS